jgi:hypothetical protein
MDLCQLEEISWQHLAWGYLFANVLGSILIPLVMSPMRKLVGHEPPKEIKWQPHVTGIIERTLYITALFVKRPEIILAWPLFKVAGGWQVWGQRKVKSEDEEYSVHKGRAIFSNMFNGTALSIFYAFCGYLIAVWWNERAVCLAVILIALTLILYIWLCTRLSKMPKSDC